MFQSKHKFTPVFYSKKEFIEELNKLILQNLNNEALSIEFLAQAVGLSRSQLYRRVKEITQLSISEYVRRLRLKLAAQLLRKYSNSVGQIAFEVGFNNLSYFSKAFKKEFGTTPIEYSRMHNESAKS